MLRDAVWLEHHKQLEENVIMDLSPPSVVSSQEEPIKAKPFPREMQNRNVTSQKAVESALFPHWGLADGKVAHLNCSSFGCSELNAGFS